MRSKADETFVIVETFICPLQIFNIKIVNQAKIEICSAYIYRNIKKLRGNDWLF